MKFDDFKALRNSDEYADNLLRVLDRISEEALEKLREDYCEGNPSIVLKKIYPRYDFQSRDNRKFDRFQGCIYGVIRKFSKQKIEQLAKADIYSSEYKRAYQFIANFFGNETKASIKQPRVFAGQDMKALFEGLAERADKKRQHCADEREMA